MRRRILSIILLVTLIFSLCACTSSGTAPTKSSTFSILFIDVGQGDSALVECDGRYMLIDAGEKSAEDKVYEVLVQKGIQHLDILAISHLHSDHIGGMAKALTYATKIDQTLSNEETDRRDRDAFRNLERELGIDGATIKVPHTGDKYSLGSAEIEVIDVASESENDSLVLLVTYGKTKFLFTGDIEEDAQTRIADKYKNDKDEPYKVDLIKMPHHGSYTGTLYRFVRTFMPKYAIISCGENNNYGHPHRETIDLLNNKELGTEVYRTDKDGDILVKSNGKTISVEKSK